MRRSAGKGPSVWLVDDNPELRAQAVADLRSLRLDVLEIGTLDEFDHSIAETASDDHAPDAVIVDLRLGWSTKNLLAVDPIRDGLSCIERLRNTPATSSVAVVVYSALR